MYPRSFCDVPPQVVVPVVVVAVKVFLTVENVKLIDVMSIKVDRSVTEV